MFMGDNKPKEEAADVFRFELPVAAKKDLSYTVIEEKPIDSRCSSRTTPTIRFATS